MESILITIKKMLGIDEAFIAFDTDVMMNINSALMVLNQLGVGPATGFMITGKDETWSQFLLARTDLEAVKTYIYLKVRLLFDPPANSFLVDAIKNQISELEWRINVQSEKTTKEVPV